MNTYKIFCFSGGYASYSIIQGQGIMDALQNYQNTGAMVTDVVEIKLIEPLDPLVSY